LPLKPVSGESAASLNFLKPVLEVVLEGSEL